MFIFRGESLELAELEDSRCICTKFRILIVKTEVYPVLSTIIRNFNQHDDTKGAAEKPELTERNKFLKGDQIINS